MSTRRIIAWGGVFAAGALAVIGFTVFVVGVIVELFLLRQRPLSDDLSPVMQLALAGLCLSALMMLCGFGLVGLLLAVQTRRQAPGYGEAYRFIQQMQFSQAIPLLEQAVARGRETPEVLMLLTTAYANTGQLAKAQATADRAVQLFPSDPNSYITLANGYRQQASYEAAASALQRAAELDPSLPGFVYAEQGFLYLAAGNRARAMEAFRRAAQHKLPDMYSVRVYYHLANEYREAGNRAEAAEAKARMLAARAGLDAWEPILKTLDTTSYGTALRYELASIAQAVAVAESWQE